MRLRVPEPKGKLDAMTGYSFTTPVWEGGRWVAPVVAGVTATARIVNGPEGIRSTISAWMSRLSWSPRTTCPGAVRPGHRGARHRRGGTVNRPPRSGQHACGNRDRVPARVSVTNRVCSAFCRRGILGLFWDTPVGSPLPGLLLLLCSAPCAQVMRGAGDLRKFPQARQAIGRGPVGWPDS